jgi:hypothetical protein
MKTLRKALEPMREAAAILGDALMGAEDDDAVKEEINDAFTSTDCAATGPSPAYCGR